MKTWIALLRGVNVGGKNKLSMAEFRDALGKAGFEEAKTYIQSGNVVLKTDMSADKISSDIENLLADNFDIRTRVMTLSARELTSAANGNPFGQEFEAPNWMFLFFLAGSPQEPDLEAITELLSENEKFELKEKVFYFFAGDGAGRSKAMAKIDSKLGVPTTARNWRTVQKLLGMAEEVADKVPREAPEEAKD